jgi:hypothetical protein
MGMDKDAAMRYAKAWADRVHADLGELKRAPDGGFFGDLGAPEVDYNPKEGALIVRGMVFRSAKDLAGRPEVPVLLDEVSQRDAKELAGGRLELAATRAHGEEGPWLNLRRDFTDDAMPVEEFVEAVKALMGAAYTWRREKLMGTLEEANARRAPG